MKGLFDIRLIALLLLIVFLSSCTTTNPYTREQKMSKTATGATIGAVVGAAAGALTGGNTDNAQFLHHVF